LVAAIADAESLLMDALLLVTTVRFRKAGKGVANQPVAL
jgi:hypothetical protein